MYTTVVIQSKDADGTISTGTGFYFTFEFPGRGEIPTVVTNKHVIDGAVEFQFLVHRANPDGTCDLANMPITFKGMAAEIVIPHPNPEIDLCIVLIAGMLEALESRGDKVFRVHLAEKDIPDEGTLADLTAMEDATMIGYPAHVYDYANNLPVLRRGTTASHPATDFDGRPDGILDIACFPGSSGSPILIINEGSFWRKKDAQLLHGSRTVFLGITYAAAIYNASGNVERRPIPTRAKRITVTEVPMHISYYVKARVLRTFRTVLEAKINGSSTREK